MNKELNNCIIVLSNKTLGGNAMSEFEPKKLALLRILQILEYYSDADHQLKQEDIAKRLSIDYGIDIERKAIGRNLSLLKEAGIEIESTRKGCYLAERTFENS